MRTRADKIGPGRLASEPALAARRADAPELWGEGTAIGQHLSVTRLARVAEGRAYYLLNNLSRKWKRRMCWACGNKHSPERAANCDFCGTPLRNHVFLMASRWDGDFRASEDLVLRRFRHFGLMSPVTVVYRGGRMLQVYHYDDQAFLLDAPSPMATDHLVAALHRIADVVGFLHHHGVQLRRLDARHVLRMPDGTVRLFDLDVAAIHRGGVDVLRHDPADPIRRDTAAIARILLPFLRPGEDALFEVLDRAVRGQIDSPIALRAEVERLEATGGIGRAPEWAAAALRDVGLLRAVNEDAWGWRRLPDGTRVLAVADGMGGHERGDVASTIAVHAALEALTVSLRGGPPAGDGLKDVVSASLGAANAAVAARRRSEGGIRMGATLVVAVVDGKRLAVGHAGDSRAYLWHGGRLSRITRDHSVVAELLEAKRITPEQVASHPSRGVLTVVVGGEDDFEPDVTVVEPKPGDRLLLCSDGVWGALDDAWIANLLGGPLEKIPPRVVRNAVEAWGEDNLVVLLAEI